MKKVIINITKRVEPITPINFSSVPRDFTFVDATEFEAIEPISVIVSGLMLVETVGLLVIIEFLKRSLDFCLFFFEFFLATITSVSMLICFLIS